MLRKLRHWLWRVNDRGYTGPREGAVLLKDGTVVPVPHFADRAGSDAILRSFSADTVAGVLLHSSRGGWSGEAEVSSLRGPHTVFATGASLTEVAGMLKAEIANAERLHAAQTATPEAELEARLASRDWTSHMSDDFRHWSAGEADDRRIEELHKLVAPKVYEELMAKYAP